MREREKWERRYQQAGRTVFGTEPSLLVRQALPLLPKTGLCLDVGGGEGRNALYFARHGFQVIVADCAVAALARARTLFQAARQRGCFLAADLQTAVFGAPREVFDLLLVMNYHDRMWVSEAHRWLRPRGVLVVQGFAKEQLGRGSGGPSDPAFLWGPNELLELASPRLRIVHYEDRLVEEDDNPAHRGPKWVVRLIAIKPPIPPTAPHTVLPSPCPTAT